jgi:hypothetical protein
MATMECTTLRASARRGRLSLEGTSAVSSSTLPSRPARHRALRAVQAVVCGVALLATAAVAAPSASAAQPGARSAGFPTYLKGVAVNQATGAQLSGIVVTLRDPVTLDVIASDTTNASGVFRMDGLDSDEYAIKFNGSRRGFETGFGGCGRGVVPTYGEACTFAPGGVGKFRLEHL